MERSYHLPVHVFLPDEAILLFPLLVVMVIILRSPLTPPVLALTDHFKMMLTEPNALRDTGKKEEPLGQYTPGKLSTDTHKQEHQCTKS